MSKFKISIVLLNIFHLVVAMTRFPSVSQAFVRTLRSSAIREEWRRGDAMRDIELCEIYIRVTGIFPSHYGLVFWDWLL